MRPRLSLLVTTILLTGCISRNIPSGLNPPDTGSLQSLPVELQVEHFSFDKLLGTYDSLPDKQKLIALQYFLSQENPDKRQTAEAAYMLGRLNQQSGYSNHQPPLPGTVPGDQVLALFDQALNYPPLKLRSLWHKSEVAANLGKEKLVRKSLSDILAECKDPASIATAQYALSQSYLRANETDRATRQFKKIRAEFPHTDYAFGSGYYLGTLAYTQLVKQLNTGNPYSSALFRTVCAYYFEYLQVSPSGHFAQDILSKLEKLISHGNGHWSPNRNQLALMANAYAANGQYKSALSDWQKAGADNHLFAIANCLIKLGQITGAKEAFFKGMAKNPCPPDYLFLANEICLGLNRAESLNFWQRLHSPKFCHQDEALWNLAIRSSLPQALNLYQEILAHYPESNHAPQAQWWIFWHRLKLNQNKSQMANLAFAAAQKYNHSKLAARFLFWTAKIFESMSDKQHALIYYQQTAKLFPYDYYGLLANTHCLALQNMAINNNSKTVQQDSISQNWDWPVPESAINDLKNTDQTYELIYLKQYAEALSLDQNNSFSPELTAWLTGKAGQPWLAINIASQALKEQLSPSSKKMSLQYYSYPLLYNQEIAHNCQKTNLVDPLLIQALIREESRYNPHAISQARALGLCQLMPGTANGVAKSLGIQFTGAKQLYDPDFNLSLGIAYLSSLLRAFHGDKLLAIASYNAGINAVKNQLPKQQDMLSGDPDYFLEDFPFRETRDYIRNVFASYWSYRQIYKYN